MKARNLNIAIVFLSSLFLSSACAAWERSPTGVSVEIVDDYGQIFRAFDVTRSGETAIRRAYLEAVRGKRYGIRVRNHTGERVGIVLAVDGRNIISGAQSNLRRHEPMYVLNPWQSAVYDGWRTSDTRVHRFFFTDADGSYAGALGDKTAMGVIALAVYAEKPRARPEQRYEKRSGGYGGRNSAPSAAREDSAKSSADEAAEPGTGFGEDIHSQVIRVAFEPAHRPFAKHFMKYEWRETLVRMGFIGVTRPANRFWPDTWGHVSAPGYAPYPPGYSPPTGRW
ncbi:MAG TPA: hypothetical protein VIT83_02955 [Gammaproteobacteria bacterium]